MIPVLQEETVLLAAAGITVVTLMVGVVTMATAWWYNWKQQRRNAVRERLREQLLSRLFDPDADWDPWVADLSNAELKWVRELLDEYLRQLRGSEHERLQELARELGIPAKARGNLDLGRNRFAALTWLALLKEDVERDRLERCCTDSPQLRAGAAQVLYRSDYPEASRIGTKLLVGDGQQPLSAFGLDTLYRLNRDLETPLLTRMMADVDEWADHVLIQTLLVLQYSRIEDPGDRIDWLLDGLDHDLPQVRAATVGVLERHGWRKPIRTHLDIDELVVDPDPMVRTNVFMMLAAWGDEASADVLKHCVDQAYDRQLLAVLRALSLHPRADLPEAKGRVGPFVEWVRADEAVTGHRNRVWGSTAAWT